MIDGDTSPIRRVADARTVPVTALLWRDSTTDLRSSISARHPAQWQFQERATGATFGLPSDRSTPTGLTTNIPLVQYEASVCWVERSSTDTFGTNSTVDKLSCSKNCALFEENVKFLS